MKHLNILILLIMTVAMHATSKNMVTPKEENIVVQMNYCITSLTNIVHNKTMPVLEHESDQLVNNLTMEQIIGMPEIRDFRLDLMDAVSKFEITEEERNLMRRIQSIKRDNMKWSALSNALNPTMLLTGNGGGMGPQIAFQVLLTAARSTVEYKMMKGEQGIEELQAMWELRKEDMQTINELRKSAQSIVFDLFNKYHLRENDRLTESTANLFSDYIVIDDAKKRIRVLLDNYELYKKIPEYYYYLGMAYLDNGLYSNAKTQFDIYMTMYSQSPILRYDEKSGCIALARLTNEKTLSTDEKEELINVAIKNLPNNSAAVLQCALVYICELNQSEKGFKLLLSGIDDINASDRDILYMALANLIPTVNKNTPLYRSICDVITKADNIGYDSFATFLINSKSNVWKQLSTLNYFTNTYKRSWYTFFCCKKFSRNFHIKLPEMISTDLMDFKVFVENHESDEISVWQMKPSFVNSIKEKDINDVACFKANKKLKYLYVDAVAPGVYKLKDNIDIEKIKDESYPRQSEFVLSQDDIDDIVDFCEDNKKTLNDNELYMEDIDGLDTTYTIGKGITVNFKGEHIAYKPHFSEMQEGYYVHIILNNGFQISYKFDDDTSSLNPYFYFDGKERTFINKDAQIEYTYTDKKEQEPSWWSKAWTSITSIFSSDDETTEQEPAKEEKNTSQEEKKQTKASNEDESSWYENAWATIKGVFSSDN